MDKIESNYRRLASTILLTAWRDVGRGVGIEEARAFLQGDVAGGLIEALGIETQADLAEAELPAWLVSLSEAQRLTGWDKGKLRKCLHPCRFGKMLFYDRREIEEALDGRRGDNSSNFSFD